MPKVEETLPWRRLLLVDKQIAALDCAVFKEEHDESAPKQKVRESRRGSLAGQGVVCRTYEIDHMDAYIGAGLAYPPSMPADFLQEFAGYTRRLKELIYFLRMTQGPAWEMTDTLVFRDINMSLPYGKNEVNVCPCLVSTNIMYCRGSFRDAHNKSHTIDRVLTGQEILSLQGFDLDKQVASMSKVSLRRFSFAEYADLGGNAFAAPCPMMVFHEMLTFLPPEVWLVVDLPAADDEAEDNVGDGDSPGEVYEYEEGEEEEVEDPDMPVVLDDADDVFFESRFVAHS